MPLRTFFLVDIYVVLFSELNARAARVLLALVIPGHLIFMYTISFMKAGHTSITPIFTVMYLIAALLQVSHFKLSVKLASKNI